MKTQENKKVTKVLTPYMLRKKLHEVNKHSARRSSISNTTTNTLQEETEEVTIEEVTITQVKGNTMYTKDNEKVIVYNPLPGISWECTGHASNRGIVVLEKPFKAIVIKQGDKLYLQGILGSTSEFRLTFQVGNNKVQIGKYYVNIQCNHLLLNGVEVDHKTQQEKEKTNGGTE